VHKTFISISVIVTEASKQELKNEISIKFDVEDFFDSSVAGGKLTLV